MDETVMRAMQRWPNVPAVYGWLQLDRRGNWLIKTTDGRFERILNPAMIEFVNRNYTVDDQGRWYFQNGPQRVFVSLEYTPWVYRLDDTARGVMTHTGAAATDVASLYLDDADSLLVETALGVGVLLDRDLPAFLAQLQVRSSKSIEQLIDTVVHGNSVACRLFGRDVPIAPIRASDVPKRFRFDPRPPRRPDQSKAATR